MEFEISFRVSINVFEKLRKKGAEFKRKVGDKYLYHDGSSFNLVDKDSLPKKLEEDNKTINRSNRHTEKKRWTGREKNRYSHLPEDEEDRLPERKRSSRRNGSETSPARKQRLRDARKSGLERESDAKVAKRAADNHYIMQDVLSDPSMVGAESETEAVAKVAAENPAWAKLNSLTDAYDIEVDADGNVESPGNGEATGGSGTDLAEAASDAAHGDTGEVSTADASDLGPSTAADHGLNSGGSGDSGSSSGGESTGSIGGSAGGGDSGSSGSGSSGSGLGGSAGGGDT